MLHRRMKSSFFYKTDKGILLICCLDINTLPEMFLVAHIPLEDKSKEKQGK